MYYKHMGLKIHKQEQKERAREHEKLTVTAANVSEVFQKVKKGIEKKKKHARTNPDKIKISQGLTLVKKEIKKAEQKAEVKEREKKHPNEYKMFSVWLTLPRMILGKTDEEYDKMGIDDPVYRELLSIRTQKQFAEKVGVSEDTITAWRKELSGMKNDKDMHSFFDQFTKALLLSFYREQMRRPTPQGIETWYEIIKDRKKNLNINLDGEVKSTLSDEDKAELRSIIKSVKRRA